MHQCGPSGYPLRHRVLAGNVRLSVAVVTTGAGSALPEVRAPEGAAAGAGATREAYAQLLPGTAASVLRIAGDYGQLVRDYNAVVDRYESARAVCNADPVTGEAHDILKE